MVKKVNIEDMCKLLDAKANIDDVNHELSKLFSNIDSKLPTKTY